MTQFLVASAAKDFQTQTPPHPARVRGVHIGYTATADGERLYLLCGRFQPDPDTGHAEWTAFATIKTRDYEQWIGAAAAERCQQPSITWASEDLSSSLQSALDSRR